MGAKRIILIFLAVFLFIEENTICAQTTQLAEKDSVVISSLQKGKRFVGFGGNLYSDLNKNTDELIYYIHDEKDSNLGIKIKAGYFVQDRKAVGFRFDFNRNRLNILYSSFIDDSTRSIVNNTGYTFGIFQKYYAPVFNSNRVYFITQPEISYSYDFSENERILNYEGSISGTSKKYTIDLGVHFGIAVFPIKGFSLEGKVGPLGVGYSWENFFENGKKDLNSENLFINLAPRAHLISFTITSYF